MLSSNDGLEKRSKSCRDLTNREMGTLFFFFCVFGAPDLSIASLGKGCINKDKSFLPSTRGTNFEGLAL